jgi:peptidoglycan/xylan/chitin deacetylase (PgdA/CDA1 family)
VNRRLILTYHSIDSTGSVISIEPQTFRAQMACLASRGVLVRPLHELPHASEGIAITFDDGFRNFYEQAFPVLLAHNLPATVFVVSGYCGRTNDWPSQPVADIPRMPLMNWREIEEVRRYGIEIGAHTVNHSHLTTLGAAQVEREFVNCRDEIEQRTGRSVTSMAYPYGDCSSAVRESAARYFNIACGTALASVPTCCDLLHLPRIDAYYVQHPFWFQSLLSTRSAAYLVGRRALRNLRRKIFQ